MFRKEYVRVLFERLAPYSLPVDVPSVIAGCEFYGSKNNQYHITLDNAGDTIIENCLFDGSSSAIRIGRPNEPDPAKQPRRVLIRNCEIRNWQTYGIAIYGGIDIHIENLHCHNPIPGENRAWPRQAIVAYGPTRRLRIDDVIVDGLNQPHPRGPGDMVSIQHATDFSLRRVWCYGGGEMGIAVVGSRCGTLYDCRAFNNDAHGIQIGLAEGYVNGVKIPAMPSYDILLDHCITGGNALRRDGKTQALAGFYFQNAFDCRMTSCLADEDLNAVQIALCRDIKLSNCELRAKKRLAIYTSEDCGIVDKAA